MKARRGIETFVEVLDAVGEKPADTASRDAKKNYAERLSQKIAVLIANKLRPNFPTILPRADESGHESKVASGAYRKPKKTDVRYGTADTGLELLVSIKTLSFRDAATVKGTGELKLGRYTKNMVRNDHELRAEAMDLHDRFPYAVLVGVLFLPFNACDDAKDQHSSFGHAVMTLRPRTGRVEPSDPAQKFERLFIALYEPDGPERGMIEFFDVMQRPPKQGRPGDTVGLEAFLDEVKKAYDIRNGRYFDWAEGPSAVEAEVPVEGENQQDDA